MKAIIGLGNPEERFANTRHNVGFRAVGILAQKLGLQFESSPKLFSAVAKSSEWLLVKPQTYMNESGKAVQVVLNFYKLAPSDIVVVHDDLALPFGTWKKQFATGPKIHNGLLSIYESLGTKDFMHLRIGIDNRDGDKTLPGKDYVLQPFADQEETQIRTVIEEVAQYLLK